MCFRSLCALVSFFHSSAQPVLRFQHTCIPSSYQSHFKKTAPTISPCQTVVHFPCKVTCLLLSDAACLSRPHACSLFHIIHQLFILDISAMTSPELHCSLSILSPSNCVIKPLIYLTHLPVLFGSRQILKNHIHLIQICFSLCDNNSPSLQTHTTDFIACAIIGFCVCLCPIAVTTVDSDHKKMDISD